MLPEGLLQRMGDGSDPESREHSNFSTQGSPGLVSLLCHVGLPSVLPACENPWDRGGQAVFWGPVCVAPSLGDDPDPLTDPKDTEMGVEAPGGQSSLLRALPSLQHLLHHPGMHVGPAGPWLTILADPRTAAASSHAAFTASSLILLSGHSKPSAVSPHRYPWPLGLTPHLLSTLPHQASCLLASPHPKVSIQMPTRAAKQETQKGEMNR